MRNSQFHHWARGRGRSSLARSDWCGNHRAELYLETDLTSVRGSIFATFPSLSAWPRPCVSCERYRSPDAPWEKREWLPVQRFARLREPLVVHQNPIEELERLLVPPRAGTCKKSSKSSRRGGSRVAAAFSLLKSAPQRDLARSAAVRERDRPIAARSLVRGMTTGGANL